MARDGSLLPSDLVWKEGMPEWRPAGDSRSLFPKARRARRPVKPEREPQGDDPEVAGWERRKPLVFGGAAAAGLAALAAGFALLGWRGGGSVGEGGTSPAVSQAERQRDESVAASGGQAPTDRPTAGAAAAESARVPGTDATPAAAAAGSGTAASDATATPVDQPPACLTPLADWPYPEAASRRLPGSCALSPDGGTLAVGLDDGRLALFDVARKGHCRVTEPARPPVESMPGPTDPACSIAFAASGRTVAWGTPSCHFAIANLADGAVTWRPPLAGLVGKANSLGVALRDDETMLIATPAGIAELTTIDVCRPLNGRAPWSEAADRGSGGSVGMTFVTHLGGGPLGRGPGFWPGDARAPTLVAMSSSGSCVAVVGAGDEPAVTFVNPGAGRIQTSALGLSNADVGACLLVAVDESAAIVATPTRILLISGTGGDSRALAELPAPAGPAAIGLTANRRCAVLGRSDGSVLILAFPAEPGSGPAKIDRLVLDGSGPAHAAISPDGSRVFTTRGGRVVEWGLDAARVGPPPAPPPEATRSE